MTRETWTDLLRQAGEAHHDAFASTDGDDPDWPAWYAAWLLERASDPGPETDEAQLAQLLAEAAEDHKASGSAEDWPGYYSGFLMERLKS